MILTVPQSAFYTFGNMWIGSMLPSLSIARAVHSVLIVGSLAPTPWSIDPERTQEI